eukprot:5879627-Alexandrium_andersonii.AAC.2
MCCLDTWAASPTSPAPLGIRLGLRPAAKVVHLLHEELVVHPGVVISVHALPGDAEAVVGEDRLGVALLAAMHPLLGVAEPLVVLEDDGSHICGGVALHEDLCLRNNGGAHASMYVLSLSPGARTASNKTGRNERTI